MSAQRQPRPVTERDLRRAWLFMRPTSVCPAFLDMRATAEAFGVAPADLDLALWNNLGRRK